MAGNSPVSLQVETGRGSAELLPSSNWECINNAARFILGDDKSVPTIFSSTGNFSSPYSLNQCISQDV